MRHEDYLPNYIDCDELTKQQITQKINAFSSLSENLPVYIIHELSSGKNAVVYMSPKGLEELGTTLEEVRAFGEKYHDIFFNPDDVVSYLAKWTDFAVDYRNKDAWFTFFQQVKTSNYDKPIWFLSASAVIAYNEATQKPLFSITLAFRLNQYLPIVPKLERLVSENNFLKEKMNLFISLTKKEKEILHFMAQGMSLKVIANDLCTSELTIKTHRRNIKKKLKIKNDVEMVQFAQAFNIT